MPSPHTKPAVAATSSTALGTLLAGWVLFHTGKMPSNVEVAGLVSATAAVVTGVGGFFAHYVSWGKTQAIQAISTTSPVAVASTLSKIDATVEAKVDAAVNRQMPKATPTTPLPYSQIYTQPATTSGTTSFMVTVPPPEPPEPVPAAPAPTPPKPIEPTVVQLRSSAAAGGQIQ